MSHSLLLVVAHLACQPQASLGTVLDDSVVLDYPDSGAPSRELDQALQDYHSLVVRCAFRTHLPQDQEVLEHLVQLDEAYFGGRNGKALFLGKQVGTRKLAFQVVPQTNLAKEHAYWFLQFYIRPNTRLHTDGAGIYKEINQWWPVYHYRDIHKKWEFELTSEIEDMFGVLRTFIRRMYHHVSSDKLPELVMEFCYRFSHPEMFENLRYYLEKSLFIVPTR